MSKRASFLGCGVAFTIGAMGYGLVRPNAAAPSGQTGISRGRVDAVETPPRPHPREREDEEAVSRVLLAVKSPADHEEEMRATVRRLIREPGFINAIWNQIPQADRTKILETLLTKVKEDAPCAMWQIVCQAKFDVSSIATNQFLIPNEADRAEVYETISLKGSEMDPRFLRSLRQSCATDRRFASRILDESLAGGHYGEEVETSAAQRMMADGLPLPEGAMDLPAVKESAEDKAFSGEARTWFAAGCPAEQDADIARGYGVILQALENGAPLSRTQSESLCRPALGTVRTGIVNTLIGMKRIDDVIQILTSPRDGGGGGVPDQEIANVVEMARQSGVDLPDLNKLMRTTQDEGTYQRILSVNLKAAAKEDPDSVKAYLSQVSDPGVRAEIARIIEQSSTQP